MRTIAHRPVRRFVAFALLPCYLAACFSWKTQEVSPEQLVAEQEPSKVRVTRTDSIKVVIEEPRVSGDSLRGVCIGKEYPSSVQGDLFLLGQQASVALADVSSIAVEETEVGKTALVVVAGLAVVGLAVLAAHIAATWPEN
ncbi:MAG: hypothetical protein GTO22_21470 [Gemmatimonadales bacterium]|nr:hypothetical protein [Gemmatimonadales bacterium]